MRGKAGSIMHAFYEIRRKSFSVKNNRENVNFDTHFHSDIEILYMRSGRQDLIIGDSRYTLNKGEAAVIFPNVSHKYIREKSEAADEILIICSEKMYRGFISSLTDLMPENPIVSNVPEEAVYAFGKIDKTSNKDIQLAWIVIILSQLLERLSLTKKKPYPLEDICYKIVKYTEENFTENLTLKSVAEALSVSESYVSRIFSEKIKMNFRRYIGVLRAENAARLIRTTNDSLTVISANSGFESQSTFNRVFREIYGMTPREFRHNIERYSKN